MKGEHLAVLVNPTPEPQCSFTWGEFGCTKPPHDETVKHALVGMYFEDDEP
jgi:hypothetical protein